MELAIPAADASSVLAGWRDLALDAPRSATYTLAVAGGVSTVGYVWVGDPERGRALLPGLRSLGRPVAERVVDLSYLDLQTRDDTVRGHAQRRYWKGPYLRDLPAAAPASKPGACSGGGFVGNEPDPAESTQGNPAGSAAARARTTSLS